MRGELEYVDLCLSKLPEISAEAATKTAEYISKQSQGVAMHGRLVFVPGDIAEGALSDIEPYEEEDEQKKGSNLKRIK